MNEPYDDPAPGYDPVTKKRRFRNRQISSALDIARLDSSDESRGDSFVGVTVAIGTYPTTVKAYYAVQPVDMGGVEAEGSTVTTTNAGKLVYAANTGSAVPPQGTRVRVDPAPGGRNVFAYFGG